MSFELDNEIYSIIFLFFFLHSTGTTQLCFPPYTKDEDISLEAGGNYAPASPLFIFFAWKPRNEVCSESLAVHFSNSEYFLWLTTPDLIGLGMFVPPVH